MNVLHTSRAIHRPGSRPSAVRPPAEALSKGSPDDRPSRDPPGIVEASPVPPRSIRARFEDAGPLWFITATCALVGTVLHVTSPGVGAGPLEVWTLFYALGAVAAVGAGVSMAIEEGEERGTEARRNRPAAGEEDLPETSEPVATTAGRRVQPAPPPPRAVGRRREARAEVDLSDRPLRPATASRSSAPLGDDEGMAGEAVGRGMSAAEVLGELDRLEEDLNRSRHYRRKSRAVPPV